MAFPLFLSPVVCDHTSLVGSFPLCLSGYSLFSNALANTVHWILPRFIFFVKVPSLREINHLSVPPLTLFSPHRFSSANPCTSEYLQSFDRTSFSLVSPPFSARRSRVSECAHSFVKSSSLSRPVDYFPALSSALRAPTGTSSNSHLPRLSVRDRLSFQAFASSWEGIIAFRTLLSLFSFVVSLRPFADPCRHDFNCASVFPLFFTF